MAARKVPPNRLWDEIRYNIESVKQDFAAELAEMIIDRTPILTGRLIRSVNINNGQNPKRQDRWRNKTEASGHSALRAQKKAAIRAQTRKRVKNSSFGKPWWIIAAAPYASYVHKALNVRNGRRYFMRLSKPDIEKAKAKALANNRRRA